MNWGINNAGDIVGTFNAVNGRGHGFLLKNGRFTQIDYPGAVSTVAWGINNSGQIVGARTDSNGAMHGYVARVTLAGPPSPVWQCNKDCCHPRSQRDRETAV